MWEYLYLLVGFLFYFLFFLERTNTHFFIKFFFFFVIIFAWPYYLIGLIVNKNLKLKNTSNIKENKNHKKIEAMTMKKFAIKIGENLYSNHNLQPYGSNIKPSPIMEVYGLRKAKLFESEELANHYWTRNKKYMNIGDMKVMIVEYKIKKHE